MKISKKNYLSVLLIILLIITNIITLSYKSFYSKNNNSEKPKLTYEEYQLLFEEIINDLSVPNLNIKASTLGDNVTVFDKDLSFNTRNALTLTGDFNSGPLQPTAEYFILENIDQSKQFTIGLYFNNSYIGEDLVGWHNNYGFDNLNENLVKNVNYLILTYKNLIITIHQNSIDVAERDDLLSLTRNLIKIISKN